MGSSSFSTCLALKVMSTNESDGSSVGNSESCSLLMFAKKAS